jgi:hypothetical protein
LPEYALMPDSSASASLDLATLALSHRTADRALHTTLALVGRRLGTRPDPTV